MCSASSAIFWMWSWASCAQMTRRVSLLWVKCEWAQRILKHFGFFQCRVEFQACWICFKFLSSPSIKPLQSCFFYHRNTSRIIFDLPFSLFFFNFNEQFLKIHQKSRNQNVLSTEESRMYECWQQEAEKQTDGLDRRQTGEECEEMEWGGGRVVKTGRLTQELLGGQTWLRVRTRCVGPVRHQRALFGCSHLSCLLGTGRKRQNMSVSQTF